MLLGCCYGGATTTTAAVELDFILLAARLAYLMLALLSDPVDIPSPLSIITVLLLRFRGLLELLKSP